MERSSALLVISPALPEDVLISPVCAEIVALVRVVVSGDIFVAFC